jgi:trehalose 6-phosphate phosphatase
MVREPIILPPPPPDRGWAFFLDIDGTLVDLAPSPDAVRVARETLALLRALHARTGGAVALITGRALRDIDGLFPDLPLAAAGQHGLERRDASGALTLAEMRSRDLTGARARLAALVAEHAALILEDKGLTLALHYRAAPQLVSVVRQTIHAAQAELGDDYAVLLGKDVLEIRPAGVDKGDAIVAFMTSPPFAGRIPVFIGDDVTDEDGFAAVNARDGYSIKVGEGATIARYRLRDRDAVAEWLGSLVDSRHSIGPSTAPTAKSA